MIYKDSTIFSFTKFTKDHGILTKKFIRYENGKIKVDGSQCQMSSGGAQKVTLTLPDLPNFLMNTKDNQAIGHGVCEHDQANIVSVKKFKNQPGTITRTKNFLSYPDPALTMLDYDPDEGQAPMEYQDVIKTVDSVCPGFAAIPKVLAYSTSSCIYDRDIEIKERGAGFHLYFLVKKGDDLPRFAKTLFHRLWLAGYGYIKLSRSGAMLPRTIFDTAVFSPERLDFVAGAHFMGSNRLSQRRPDPIYIPGGSSC